MKKVSKLAAVMTAFGMAGASYAAVSANFNVTANISGAFSVTIVSGAPVAFGAVAAGSLNNVTATPVVVQNNSAGFVEDYQIGIANALTWVAAAAQGPNQATLFAKFNTVAVASASFVAADQMITASGNVLAGTSPAGNFAGDQDGQDVNPSESNNLWLKLQAPTTDSSGGATQTFVVTITAVAP